MTEENNANSTNPEPQPRHRWIHRAWGALPTVAVFLLIGVVVLLFNHIRTEGEVIKERKASELRTARPKTNVVAMEMAPGRLRQRINLPGVVKPWVSLTVVAEIKGIIVEKTVTKGDRVKKGDVLVRIDSRDYRNAYQSAKASYSLAAANQKRIKALYKDKVATQSQIDDIDAQVRTTKALMDNAALNLERCTIRSPMNGVVNRLHVEIGQFMDVGNAVSEVLDIDRVKIEVGIPESDVAAVRELALFDVTIDALGGEVFQGTFHYLYKTSESMARLYNLEIAVDNPLGEILPDMFVRVEVIKHEVAEGLSVPLYSMIRRNELAAVYVLDGDVVRLKPVEVGIQDGWRVEIRKGLAPGDRVVVIGQRIIEDGESVNVSRTVRTMEELTQ